MQLLSAADISKFLLAATLLLAPALSAAAEPSATDLRRMEEQVAKQTAESERLAQEAKQINQEIDTISRKMIRYANLIQNNEEKISSMETELQQLQTELNAAEAEFSLEDENLIKTLAALQNLALKPTESLFVQPLTPVEIIRSAMLLRETVPYLEQNAQRIKIKLEQIDKQKQKVETQFNKIVAQKKLLEQEHDELAALSKKKSTLRNSIEQQSAAAKKKVSKLASQAQDLRDLLGKLEAERLKKQQEEERRRLAEEQRRKKQEEAAKADLIKLKPQAIKELGEGFVKAKGKLPMPARGTIVTRYGEETSKGVSSKGIIVKTRPQAQVISPFDGNVIFAGPFRGYGNLIIIEHGKGYLSLLAGLDSINCELGQMLLAGEPVGQMPDSSDSKLYIEIRKDNHPINPLTWIKK